MDDGRTLNIVVFFYSRKFRFSFHVRIVISYVTRNFIPIRIFRQIFLQSVLLYTYD